MFKTAAPTSDQLNSEAQSTWLNELLPALQRLDQLLEQAVTIMRAARGSEVEADLYRGLYISPADFEEWLNQEPGQPRLWSNNHQSATLNIIKETSRLGWLQRAFNLSEFEMDIMLIALAPELDRRYENLYAYLQDHVSRRRPSVDLVFNLLCPDAIARIEWRNHFRPTAPLIREGIIHLQPSANQEQESLLAQEINLDQQIVNFLLHQDGLDARLSSFCEFVSSPVRLNQLPITDELGKTLPNLVGKALETGQPLHLYFQGPLGVGRRQIAAALSLEVGFPLLRVDLRQALLTTTDLNGWLKLLLRESWFQDAILYLDGVEALFDEQYSGSYYIFLDELSRYNSVILLAGTEIWPSKLAHPSHFLNILFPMPSFEQRQHWWRLYLETVGVKLAQTDENILAGRFRLRPGQIAQAVNIAVSQARWRQASHSADEPLQITLMDLFSAARAQTGQELAELARKVEPVYTWEDIVLPEDALAQLHEMCYRVTHRHRVLDEWGFRRKLTLGKGINALFAGPSGTGKTMAAEIVANELGLDLYKIDLSGVVSKYIGETEKNLNRIFSAAENANAILFFDEADALFGKRSEVRDSHDRYANIEISYLLQKMESYDGIAILTTNLRQNLDDAFVRRMAFTVQFPFPDAESRLRIWQGIWPTAAPLAAEIDLAALADQFRLSGGNIKNVALAAAFLAAEAGHGIGARHVAQAIRREYQKMGKSLSKTEIEEQLL
ncbi:MAG: ATP-binding protein [Anaerolineae bacterium]|nr:ATP-binding protein [Anaerolineae bacterium]